MPKTILVVDDLFDDLESMKKVLEKGGYGVSTATNGARALDALNEQKFDLILIDIQMPTVSGYDLLRLIRDKVKENIKLIYVTIVPKEEVDIADVDGFVQKPFKPSDPLKEVRKVLKER